MIKNIKYEYIKTKRSYIYITMVLLLILSIVWIMWGTHRSLAPDKEKILVTNISVVNNVVYPLLITVLANNIYNIEINTKVINILPLFNIKISKLFITKLYFLIINMILFIIFEQVSLNFIHPLNNNIELFISLLLSSILISIIQLGLSFTMKRENLPLFIGLAGTMISLVTSGHLPPILNAIIPWESIAFLAPISLTNNGFEQNQNYGIKVIWIAVVIIIIGCYFYRKVHNEYDKNY